MSSQTLSTNTTSVGSVSLGWTWNKVKGMGYPVLGIGILLAIWWFGGYLISSNPNTEAFAAFAPGPTFHALYDIVVTGRIWDSIVSSLYRILVGMFWGAVIGIPVGVIVGYFGTMMKLTNIPFQFLRMISPLAWMPIAVIAFASWDSAIIFLIVMATVWPIIFSTAHGVRRIDPTWFKVAKNLGGSTTQVLRHVIMPAIMTDVLAGVRLAVGVAWVVLVPAEYLGVTSGLGYSINDARDTLEYDTLAAIVIVIGLIGYGLDWICQYFIKKSNWHIE